MMTITTIKGNKPLITEDKAVLRRTQTITTKMTNHNNYCRYDPYHLCLSPSLLAC